MIGQEQKKHIPACANIALFSKMEFVGEKLREWGLDKFVENFEGKCCIYFVFDLKSCFSSCVASYEII